MHVKYDITHHKRNYITYRPFHYRTGQNTIKIVYIKKLYILTCLYNNHIVMTHYKLKFYQTWIFTYIFWPSSLNNNNNNTTLRLVYYTAVLSYFNICLYYTEILLTLCQDLDWPVVSPMIILVIIAWSSLTDWNYRYT